MCVISYSGLQSAIHVHCHASYKQLEKCLENPWKTKCKPMIRHWWFHLCILHVDLVISIGGGRSKFWQNYLMVIYCRRNLLNVLDFLKRPNASALVSGTRDRVNLYDKFRNAIEDSFPGIIDELTRKEEEKQIQKNKPSFWDSVIDSKAGAFKFSF